MRSRQHSAHLLLRSVWMERISDINSDAFFFFCFPFLLFNIFSCTDGEFFADPLLTDVRYLIPATLCFACDSSLKTPPHTHTHHFLQLHSVTVTFFFIDFKFMSHEVKTLLVKLRWLQQFIPFIDENPMCNKCVPGRNIVGLCSYTKMNCKKKK